MTTIKTAKEAYNDSVARVTEIEKADVAKAIDRACAAKQFSCFAKISAPIANYLRELGYSVDEQMSFGKVQGYEISWAKLPPEYTEVTSVSELSNMITSSEEPNSYVTVASDLTLTAEDEKIVVPAGKTAHVKITGTLTAPNTAFVVKNGGTLNLTGTGTLKTTGTDTSSAIQADGPNALVVLDGVTIDTASVDETTANTHYGIYLLNDASFLMRSGTVKAAYGACIATNNTTGGATSINIKGGALLSKAYALYVSSQSNVVIAGGTVQGICARMGSFIVRGESKIIPTELTAETADDIGKYFDYSGFIWPGDAICLLTGTYKDANGTDLSLIIAGGATVASNYRAGIGVYAIDTKLAQKVSVSVANKANVTTADSSSEAIVVYDHEYIGAAATAAGKTYTAKFDSTIEMK